MTTDASKICFFFGSGISYDAEMPSVHAITNKLFEEKWETKTKDWIPNIDQLFKPSSADCATTIAIKTFLKEIKKFQGSSATYESLFGVINRLSDNKDTNIFIEPFLEKLYKECIFISNKNETYEEWEKWITRVRQMSNLYIQSVVYSLLSKQPTKDAHGDIRGLGVLTNVAAKVDRMDIFTLNHDTLIELQLNDVSDGFEQTTWGFKGVQEYKGSFKSKVRLYKLHGSINWFNWAANLDFVNDIKIEGTTRIHSGLSHTVTIQSPNNHKSPNERSPNFLTGTDKQGQYTNIPYEDLFYKQKKVFEEYDKIIFCGYGFCDNAINKRIEHWLSAKSSQKRKIVLLDKGSLDTNETIKKLRNLGLGSRVETHPNWLSECSADNLIVWAG